MAVSRDKGFQAGVYLTFFAAAALYIVVALVSAQLNGIVTDGPLLSAADKAALEPVWTAVAGPLRTICSGCMMGALLFSALRMSRGWSGVLCLAWGALQLGVYGVSSIRSVVLVSTQIGVSWASYVFFYLFGLAGSLLIYWLLTPLYARNLPEPAALFLSLLSGWVASLPGSLWTVCRFGGGGQPMGAVILNALWASLKGVLVSAVLALLTYLLLRLALRPKKSGDGLDNG